MGREVGGGFRMVDTCTPMADSCQCMAKTTTKCKEISLQLKKRYDLKCYCWTSLVVQWLRLQAPVEGGWGGRFDP